MLHEKTAGHPYYCDEIILAWKQQGKIQIANRKFVLSSLVSELMILPVPESVYKMVTGQMDRLAPELQLVLKVASVIGLTFTAQELSDVYPVTRDRGLILKFLADLEGLDFIHRDEHRTKPTYSFRNSIVEEVALSHLLFSQRQLLQDQLDKA